MAANHKGVGRFKVLRGECQSGSSIVTAVMALLILSVLGLAIITMRNMGILSSMNMREASQALYIAEAGVERGVRAVRDDTDAAPQTANPTLNGFHGIPSLDGNQASVLAGTVNNPLSARQYISGVCTLQSTGTGGGGWGGGGGAPGAWARVGVNDYQQRVNLLGSRISRVEIGCRHRTTGGTGAFEVTYLLGGEPGPFSMAAWGSTAWTTDYLDITADRVWDWTLLGNIVLRASAQAGAGGGGWGGGNNNMSVEVDYLFLRITCEIDASTEPWYSSWRNLDDTGSPRIISISLGRGAVDRLMVYDEAGKVNLNYAATALLTSLFEKCGLPAGDAASIAAGIVAYRGVSFFDTVEEVRQVGGMTAAYYSLVKDALTVYSWENTAAQRPAATRAPVNINTAPRVVLEALLDPVPGISAAEAQNVAADIITFRNTTPFTCMFTTDPNVTTSFNYFLNSVCTYLPAADINNICENADASAQSWTGANAVTTELCYYSKRFSVVSSGNIAQKSFKVVKRVFEDRDENGDGIYNIPAHTTLNYWEELND